MTPSASLESTPSVAAAHESGASSATCSSRQRRGVPQQRRHVARALVRRTWRRAPRTTARTSDAGITCFRPRVRRAARPASAGTGSTPLCVDVGRGRSRAGGTRWSGSTQRKPARSVDAQAPCAPRSPGPRAPISATSTTLRPPRPASAALARARERSRAAGRRDCCVARAASPVRAIGARRRARRDRRATGSPCIAQRHDLRHRASTTSSSEQRAAATGRVRCTRGATR